MPKYRKKPVVIEAERVSLLHQWAGRDWTQLPGWVVEPYERGEVIFANHPRRILVMTLEGTMAADHEDWLIRGPRAELYPCKPDIFKATYEPVDFGEESD